MSVEKATAYVPVAQPDRVFGYEPKGQGFESLQARHKNRSSQDGRFFYDATDGIRYGSSDWAPSGLPELSLTEPAGEFRKRVLLPESAAVNRSPVDFESRRDRARRREIESR